MPQEHRLQRQPMVSSGQSLDATIAWFRKAVECLRARLLDRAAARGSIPLAPV